MNFSYTEEQQMLRDSIARFIQKDYSFEVRRAAQKTPEGFSREVWAQLADMGILGLPFADAYGGFGGTPVDTMFVMQALGNGLMVEPYLATVVLAGTAIDLAGTDEQKAELLPKISSGELIAAFAHYEPSSRYALWDVSTTAAYSGAAGYTLNGAKSVVLAGGQADKILVSARTGTEETMSLFLIEPDMVGVTVRDYRTIDGLRAAELRFEDVLVPERALIGTRDQAWDVIERVIHRGIAALCGEAVGVMETLNAQTLDYIKTRQQFGQPIGRFQVLQHRAVDMMIHCEQSKSMALLAAMKVASEDARERRRSVSAAKVQIGRAGRAVAQSAIQLHGGMGMTDELAASHYAKRLTMIDFMLGDAEHHISRFVAA